MAITALSRGLSASIRAIAWRVRSSALASAGRARGSDVGITAQPEVNRAEARRAALNIGWELLAAFRAELSGRLGRGNRATRTFPVPWVWCMGRSPTARPG